MFSLSNPQKHKQYNKQKASYKWMDTFPFLWIETIGEK